MNSKLVSFLIVIALSLLILSSCCEAKKKKSRKGMMLRERETNVVNFIRIAAMRLIYGIATRVGLGEQISEALNGAFVPPGVDSDYGDYGGGGLFTRDEDDDDSDYDY